MTSTATLLLVTLLGQSSTAPELIEFTAPGCAACVRMEPVVRRLKRQGYVVRQVQSNQASSAQLVQRYGIRKLPTFVVVHQGQETNRLVGLASYDRLVQMLSRRANPRPVGRSEIRTNLAVADKRPTAAAVAGDASKRANAATVRVSIEQSKAFAVGSGTVIHKRGRSVLVATCGHLFRDYDKTRQPLYVEMFASNGAKPKKYSATLIRKDLKRDVGFITFSTDEPVTVARLAPPNFRVQSGQSVFSIGCVRGKEPQTRFSRVTTINRYDGPPNIQVSGEPVDGCSGGGLFALDGTLIGICNFADPADREGIYAAYPSIHHQLLAAGLSAVIEDLFPQSGQQLARQRPAANDRRVTATNTVPKSISSVQLRDVASQESRPAGFQTPAESMEVMIIVRSKDGRDRLVVLKNPSAALLRMIRLESQGKAKSGTSVRTAAAPPQSRIRRASRIVRGQR